MKKEKKRLMKLFFSFAIALTLCMISFGTFKVYAAENNEISKSGSETVSITIDNSESHLVVRFYPDTNNLDNFDVAAIGEKKAFEVCHKTLFKYVKHN